MKKFQGTFRTSTIIQASKDGELPTTIKVLPRGVFNTTKYGELQITEKIMDEMIASFRPEVRPVSIDRDHAPLGDTRAAGWIESLIKKEDGLHAGVSWTPYGAELVGNREYRMLSPEWSYDYVDSEDRQELGATLLAVALTNRPLFKSVGTLTASEGLTNDIQVFILASNSMNIQDILAKPAAERTEEEVKYLVEHKEEMTEEQATQYESETTTETQEETTTEEESTQEETTTEETTTETKEGSNTEAVTITASELASFKAMQEENQKLKAAQLKASIEKQVDTLICNANKETRILRKSKDAVITFLMSLSDTQRDDFYKIANALPGVKIVGEIGDGGAENSPLTAAAQLATLTTKKASELKIDYMKADAIVKKENPELVEQYLKETKK
jgi:phage I-like protein